MLGRGVQAETDPFGAVAPWLQEADLVFGNLEGVLSEQVSDLGVQTPQGPILISMTPDSAEDLAAAGFDILGLANNHTLDFGEVGLRQTVDHLAVAGVGVVGAGPDQTVAWTPTYRRIRGVDLAFLAINAVPVPGDKQSGWGPAEWDADRAARAVREAAGRADGVIVTVHWGYEYQNRVDPAQVAVAETLLSAGADLVVGHHPHVVQGTQLTPEGDFVAYSLGNFVYDQFEGDTRRGVALRAWFDPAGLLAVQAIPVQAGPQPALLDMEAAGPLLAQLEPATWRVGFRRSGESWEPDELPWTDRSGVFVAGAIDLTGDGLPERVRLNQERVTIEQDGTLVWESPLDWDVLDLALGDPNDDGRYEMLLVMNKPDAGGGLRNHPFIIGYRGGSYQEVWGGSAVGDPILEAELADVDEDPTQELIVLEVVGEDGEVAVSVWDWHGWGFSRAWRSPEGRYRDLQVVRGADPVISVRVVR
jgi:poly-gamma-glutamate synthesis protein (capsule biosynthesis protein)